jgi:hypothetical protein
MRKLLINIIALFGAAAFAAGLPHDPDPIPPPKVAWPSAQDPGPSQALFNNPYYTCVRNFYVATTGSNSNNGSSGSPWLTIRRADSSSRAAGDCINVLPGTYTAGANIAHGGNAATSTGYVVYRCTVMDACTITENGISVVLGEGHDQSELDERRQQFRRQRVNAAQRQELRAAEHQPSHRLFVA